MRAEPAQRSDSDERAVARAREVEILALAARQYGVVGHAQLLAAGLRPKAIAYRVGTGRMRRLHRGVYAIGPAALSREGVWLAGVLAAGPGAALSHASAEMGWGLAYTRDLPRLVHVSVPTRAGRAQRAGLRIHRTNLRTQDVITRKEIPITSPARTLLDCAAGRSPRRVARLIDRAEELRLYDHGPVIDVLGAHPAHPGAARLRAALATYSEPPRTLSDLERDMFALCGDAGLPRPLTNQAVLGELVDFFWPAHRLIVETDGRETHLTRRAFEVDRARDAQLTAAGYRVVRFTHLQLTKSPEQVADILRRLLG